MNEPKIVILIIAAKADKLNLIRMILDDFSFENHGALDLEPWQERLDPSKPPAVLILFGLGGIRLQATLAKGRKTFERSGLPPPAIVVVADAADGVPAAGSSGAVMTLPSAILKTPDEFADAIKNALRPAAA